jgi:hypothetical protein
MSTNSIFSAAHPGMSRHTDEILFPYVSGRGLCQLSRVSSRAVSNLNSEQFEGIFKSRFPYLKENFPFLKTLRPDVWCKFAICVAEAPKVPVHFSDIVIFKGKASWHL